MKNGTWKLGIGTSNNDRMEDDRAWYWNTQNGIMRKLNPRKSSLPASANDSIQVHEAFHCMRQVQTKGKMKF